LKCDCGGWWLDCWQALYWRFVGVGTVPAEQSSILGISFSEFCGGFGPSLLSALGFLVFCTPLSGYFVPLLTLCSEMSGPDPGEDAPKTAFRHLMPLRATG
jgi:hypothetical protein